MIRGDGLHRGLHEGVRDETAGLRNAAMEVLARVGEPAVPSLIGALNDPDPDVRIFATITLGEMKSRTGVAPLLELLKDANENVRHASAEALGKIGDRRAVLPLIGVLESGDFWVQYPALLALGDLGDEEAVPILVKFLEDELLRQPAVESLGRIGDERAVPRILPFLSDPSRDLRNAAIKSLVELHRRAQLRRALSSTQASSDDAVAALGSLNDPTILDALIAALGDTEESLRRSAAVALGWMRDAAAVPKLLESLPDPGIAEAVKDAIVHIGPAATGMLVAA